MRQFSNFLVRRRIPVFLITLLCCAVCAVLMPRVPVNTDLTKYLPDDSGMKRGIDLLTEEFSIDLGSNTIRVMLSDVPEADVSQITSLLQGLPHVQTVSHIAKDPQYEKDGCFLYILTSGATFGSPEMKELESALNGLFSASGQGVPADAPAFPLEKPLSSYALVYSLDDTSSTNLPLWIVAIALAMILAILLVMSGSWLEPFLFLVTIGIAVVINMGTNIVLGSISDATFTIAALLQLVLSMDYSVILMNRYRQERGMAKNSADAMQRAIRGAFSSIVSSSLTTVVGLLALLFMSFKIGADMGIVLAKGVLISLICILTVLPTLILLFDGAIQKTRKKTPSFSMTGLSRFESRFRHCLLILFVVLAAFLFMMKGETRIDFTLREPTSIDEFFPKTNQIILLYANEDDTAAQALEQKLKKDPAVRSAISYTGTLGRAYTAAELSDALPQLAGEYGFSLPVNLPGVDGSALTSLLRLLYYRYYHQNEPGAEDIKLGDFVTFLTDQAVDGPFASLMPEGALSAVEHFAPLAGGILNLKTYSISEIIDLVHTVSPDIDAGLIRLACQLYLSQAVYDDAWTMTLPQLLTFTGKTLENEPELAALLPEEAKDLLSGAFSMLEEAGAALRSQSYSLLVLTTTLEDEGEEAFAFLDRMEDTCSRQFTGEWHLIGNTPMAWEMSHTFDAELNKITIITAAAIFLVVLLTFRSLLIPILLVALIQTSVYATMIIIRLQGQGIYYLALLMVQSILMGATIDYAILFTNYYKESRRTCGIADALKRSYQNSIGTILTSGLIIVLITAVLGYAFENPTVGQICHTIAKGATVALILIVFLLPGMLACADRLIIRRGK